MTWTFSYDPQIWPALITVGSATFLGWYSWRRRNVPAARFFAMGCLFAALWAAGAAMEVSAVDFSTKVFFVKFQVALQLPAATAFPCFILVYTGLGRFLSRRNLILLALPSFIFLGLIITNDYHHFVWTGFQMMGYVVPSPNIGNRLFLVYGYILGLTSVAILLWLAVRSPRYRWPVLIMLAGQVIGRGVFLLDYLNAGVLGPGESVFFVIGILSSAYGIAFYNFHVIDPVPAGRTAALEQMHEGMLVIDPRGYITDLNPIAGKILGKPVKYLLGRAINEYLPAGIFAGTEKTPLVREEINLGVGKGIRIYDLSLSSLIDRSGEEIGRLILIRDISDQKQAQTKIIEQQRVMATLEEREQLARELHDGIGQVLGYVSLQAQTAGKLIQDGNVLKAGSILGRLVEVSKDAHADVRESILGLKSGSTRDWSFVPTLRHYLDNFRTLYGINTELSLAESLEENVFGPETGIQILRVIQEAMTNARKHSGAQTVRVGFEPFGDYAAIRIVDDGSGFSTVPGGQDLAGHFGLEFMRERMEKIGGSMKIDSKPGTGTVIELKAPISELQEGLE